MELFAILLIAESVFAILFIKAGYPESTKKGFYFKMAASAIFVANGIYFYFLSDKTPYTLTVVAALILGFLGDIFLTMDPFIKNKSSKKLSTFFIILGGLFFLSEHIAYIYAFVGEIRQKEAFSLELFLTASLAVLIISFAVKILLKIRLGKFLIPIVIYSAAISSMFALAVCLALKGYPENTALNAGLFAAPLLFIISDSSLVIKYFDSKRFNTLTVRSINLGTYFLAQMLFGLSVYLI